LIKSNITIERFFTESSIMRVGDRSFDGATMMMIYGLWGLFRVCFDEGQRGLFGGATMQDQSIDDFVLRESSFDKCANFLLESTREIEWGRWGLLGASTSSIIVTKNLSTGQCVELISDLREICRKLDQEREYSELSSFTIFILDGPYDLTIFERDFNSSRLNRLGWLWLRRDKAGGKISGDFGLRSRFG
jgi:hypothetical protein